MGGHGGGGFHGGSSFHSSGGYHHVGGGGGGFHYSGGHWGRPRVCSAILSCCSCICFIIVGIVFLIPILLIAKSGRMTYMTPFESVVVCPSSLKKDSSISFSSTSSSLVRASLVPELPPISLDYNNSFISGRRALYYKEYNYTELNLVKDSVISYRLSSLYSFTFYLFSSSTEFNNFRNGDSFYYEQGHSGSSISDWYQVPKTGVYYVVIWADWTGTTVTYDFTIKHTRYQTEKNEVASCNSSCEFKPPSNMTFPGPCVIAEFVKNSTYGVQVSLLYSPDNTTLITICAVVGGIAALLVILSIVICIMCIVKGKKGQQGQTLQQPGAPGVSYQPVPAGSAIVTTDGSVPSAPPSYGTQAYP